MCFRRQRAGDFCERVARAFETLRTAATRASADWAKRGKKASSSARGGAKKESGEVSMSDLRAVTLEKAIDGMLPSVPLPTEEERAREARPPPRGAREVKSKEALAADEQKAERARLMAQHLREQTAMAPLASIREVELELEQLARREYKRALLRKEVDVTKVMWKPRELLESESERMDAAELARVRAGEKRVRVEGEEAAPSGNDAVIWLEVFHPVKQAYLVMDIIVRGSTPLAAFKDMIYCLRDVQAEREGHPKTKNGFLFIEGVFYNDLRSPDAVDYSVPLLDYQEKDALAAPGAPVEMNISGKGFTGRDMRGVTFADVPLTVGKAYVMTHQGKCEHKWRVRDVRVPHPDDESDHLMYPLVIREGRVFRRGCSICGVFDAAHVSYGDKMAAESPSFFCKICFDVVHCDATGARMYNDFEDYQYDHE